MTDALPYPDLNDMLEEAQQRRAGRAAAAPAILEFSPDICNGWYKRLFVAYN